MGNSGLIVVLGVFVADTAYRAPRPPRLGETIMGTGFALGQRIEPGGRGRPTGRRCLLHFQAGGRSIRRHGHAHLGRGRRRRGREAESYTGAAYIFVDEAMGDNAIIVCPGAGATIGVADIDANIDLIRSASVFITQLEQPIEAAAHALKIAKDAGVTTILNPAPAMPLDDHVFALCDYVTPNESETEALTGIKVASPEDARCAADALLEKGVGAATITLGEAGAIYHTAGRSEVVPAYEVAPVVETTGAGDAFNGGFATALARGLDPLEAVRFGCAVAGISVTRPGTAPSMPSLAEVEQLLKSGRQPRG